MGIKDNTYFGIFKEEISGGNVFPKMDGRFSPEPLDTGGNDHPTGTWSVPCTSDPLVLGENDSCILENVLPNCHIVENLQSAFYFCNHHENCMGIKAYESPPPWIGDMATITDQQKYVCYYGAPEHPDGPDTILEWGPASGSKRSYGYYNSDGVIQGGEQNTSRLKEGASCAPDCSFTPGDSSSCGADCTYVAPSLPFERLSIHT